MAGAIAHEGVRKRRGGNVGRRAQTDPRRLARTQQPNGFLDAADEAGAVTPPLAARGGHAPAAFDLATFNDPNHAETAAGLVAAPDPFQAYRWYTAARDAGDERASVRLEELRAWAESASRDGDTDAERLLLQLCQRHRLPVRRITEAGRRRLLAYHWPGNVRELENCIEHAVALCNDFEIDVRHLPREVLGDELRFRQILFNLIGNAIKFTEQGEVIVRLKLLALAEREVRMRFEVIDTGIGISPAQQQKIFESFSQADSSTTRRYGGTGLGLAITQSVIGQHGGVIECESHPSHTCFSVFLPMESEKRPAAAENNGTGDA